MLHVRRGDYVGNALHDVCGPSYYLAAIAEARKQIPAAAFFVFSDDIPWCKRIFAGISTHMEFHDGNGDEREDLRLMSLCKHHILPNSTFAWWAAWLGRRDGQKVFCPDRWFMDEEKNRKAMKELIYPQWVQIPSA